jgi:hypothetical protein
MATVDGLDEILLEAGVDLGNPCARRDRAVRLLNEGATVADLEELQEWAHQTRKQLHTIGKWLGWATATRERWTSTLESVRALKAKRRSLSPMPNSCAPAVLDGDERERWLRSMSYVRVKADRASPELVAQELGITSARVMQFVEDESANREAVRHEQESTW